MKESTVKLILAWVHVISLLVFMGSALHILRAGLATTGWVPILFLAAGGAGCWHWHKISKAELWKQDQIRKKLRGEA